MWARSPATAESPPFVAFQQLIEARLLLRLQDPADLGMQAGFVRSYRAATAFVGVAHHAVPFVAMSGENFPRPRLLLTAQPELTGQGADSPLLRVFGATGHELFTVTLGVAITPASPCQCSEHEHATEQQPCLEARRFHQ